ncbi:MAG: triose-phosphate isomerase [Candidatus Komeilibacteria bacterium RIFOXYC1_FULL_37_11]|uniref:Triosephosphate isomerase n=1 Tax=Candidatus Komeilibacteria bacterium RIFOXYC1_FULL_37_11 TaxID=1798555 RepID=A0A1G2BX09_9BACT|nr:MAG: triose-phosphate isomerase [Candidatus Komeilibacteria bacterium RIFOXYC1_FULL_37_11]OGY95885.1 MAG: triose-phosphate isomerase [Candidatus Komeilibacteria bacterium RIFOXYD1_FULL_37_29]
MEKYKQVIIANWKMKLDLEESVALAIELKGKLEDFYLEDKKVVLCPSFLAVHDVAEVLKGSEIALGAQDVFYEKNGSYTGEISAEDLKELDCQYVIVGHSDRRAMGETDQIVNKKIKAVLANKMIPIICVGETLKEYEEGLTKQVLARQVSGALANLDNQYFLLTYEPVWSISTSGSGETIGPAEAIKQIDIIKENIPKHLNNFDIIYGGSVTDKTVADFSKKFSGALVGGASLKAQTFFDLIKNS